MSQDFAKSRNAGAGKNAKKTPRAAATRNAAQNESPWSWFFSGLLSGVLLCVIGYYAINHLRTSSPIADISAGAEQGAEGNDREFQFYEYLPQAEVEVNVVPVEVASNAQDETNPVTYLLQAGSFQDPNDAEALRARLILLNMEVRIQPTSISGRTWYRVQAGPFIGRRSVEAAQNTLIENNIDPIRLRISG